MCADAEIAETKKSSCMYHHKIMRFSALLLMLSVSSSAVAGKQHCLTKTRSPLSESSLSPSSSFSLSCMKHWAAWFCHLQLPHTPLKCSERQRHSVKKKNPGQSAQHTAQGSRQCHSQNWMRMPLMYDTWCDSTWAGVTQSHMKKTSWSASVRTTHWALL